MESVAAAGLMVTGTVPVVVLAGLAESVAFTVMVLVPETVGVPVMTQFVPSVRPAWSVPPVRAQV